MVAHIDHFSGRLCLPTSNNVEETVGIDMIIMYK